MMLRPINDFCVVEPIEEEKTASWILLPKSIDKWRWRVVAVGPGAINLHTGLRLPMDVKIGETVYIKDYMKEQFEYKGRTLLVIAQTAILAIDEE